jgi:hypothetical protein
MRLGTSRISLTFVKVLNCHIGMTRALLKKIQSDVQASVTSDAVKDKLFCLHF